jgi:hypothetical protein
MAGGLSTHLGLERVGEETGEPTMAAPVDLGLNIDLSSTIRVRALCRQWKGHLKIKSCHNNNLYMLALDLYVEYRVAIPSLAFVRCILIYIHQAINVEPDTTQNSTILKHV